MTTIMYFLNLRGLVSNNVATMATEELVKGLSTALLGRIDDDVHGCADKGTAWIGTKRG